MKKTQTRSRTGSLDIDSEEERRILQENLRDELNSRLGVIVASAEAGGHLPEEQKKRQQARQQRHKQKEQEQQKESAGGSAGDTAASGCHRPQNMPQQTLRAQVKTRSEEPEVSGAADPKPASACHRAKSQPQQKRSSQVHRPAGRFRAEADAAASSSVQRPADAAASSASSGPPSSGCNGEALQTNESIRSTASKSSQLSAVSSEANATISGVYEWWNGSWRQDRPPEGQWEEYAAHVCEILEVLYKDKGTGFHNASQPVAVQLGKMMQKVTLEHPFDKGRELGVEKFPLESRIDFSNPCFNQTDRASGNCFVQFDQVNPAKCWPARRREVVLPEVQVAAEAELFGIIDANSDGKISRAEWESAFDKIDKNGDGLISMKEFYLSQGQAPMATASSRFTAAGARQQSQTELRREGRAEAQLGKGMEEIQKIQVYAVGQDVQGRFSRDGRWYRAKIVEVLDAGSYRVHWINNEEEDRVKTADDLLPHEGQESWHNSPANSPKSVRSDANDDLKEMNGSPSPGGQMNDLSQSSQINDLSPFGMKKVLSASASSGLAAAGACHLPQLETWAGEQAEAPPACESARPKPQGTAHEPQPPTPAAERPEVPEAGESARSPAKSTGQKSPKQRSAGKRAKDSTARGSFQPPERAACRKSKHQASMEEPSAEKHVQPTASGEGDDSDLDVSTMEQAEAGEPEASGGSPPTSPTSPTSKISPASPTSRASPASAASSASPVSPKNTASSSGSPGKRWSCKRFTIGGATPTVHWFIDAASIASGITLSYGQTVGPLVQSIDWAALGDTHGAFKTKCILLDMHLKEVVGSMKWRFEDAGGAWIKHITKKFPKGQELQVGDHLLSINGRDVTNLDRGEIENIWWEEQVMVKRRPRICRFEFGQGVQLLPGFSLVGINGEDVRSVDRERIVGLLSTSDAEGLELAFAAPATF